MERGWREGWKKEGGRQGGKVGVWRDGMKGGWEGKLDSWARSLRSRGSDGGARDGRFSCGRLRIYGF